MNPESVKALLEAVRDGRTDVAGAVDALRRMPFEDLGFASIDHHRAIRCGFPEVIFSAGKTAAEVAAIFAKLAETGNNVLATRAGPEVYQGVAEASPAAVYHERARAITLAQSAPAEPIGHIALVAAGTSDLPVAEEARVTAEIMGHRVTTHYDVGVAGIHRLFG
ncbi:hypothetical protein LCGC14_2756980, partial [marine sediment metagenome]